MRFLDWPSSENKPAIHAGLQSLMILTLEAGGELCGVLGDPATQSRVPGRGRRGCASTCPTTASSKQAAALMALAGLGDAAALNRDVMAVDGAKRMSTFYGYYVLQARAKAGDYQGCLDAIRTYWGAMLDLGATTFWEDFNLDWTANAARHRRDSSRRARRTSTATSATTATRASATASATAGPPARRPG